jgi:ParB-like chromosome segregation protein Spo0J
MNVQTIKVTDLVPYPGNPRRGNVKMIAESLTAHGQYRPLVVQESTMHVLAGNHTLEAATSLRWDEIDCVVLPVDDTQAAKIVLVDNRTADTAYNDVAALTDLLQMLDTDLLGSGYEVADLEALSLQETGADLDDLLDKVGAPEDKDLWPSLSMRVSAATFKAWKDHSANFEDADAAMKAVLDVT